MKKKIMKFKQHLIKNRSLFITITDNILKFSEQMMKAMGLTKEDIKEAQQIHIDWNLDNYIILPVCRKMPDELIYYLEAIPRQMPFPDDWDYVSFLRYPSQNDRNKILAEIELYENKNS